MRVADTGSTASRDYATPVRKTVPSATQTFAWSVNQGIFTRELNASHAAKAVPAAGKNPSVTDVNLDCYSANIEGVQRAGKLAHATPTYKATTAISAQILCAWNVQMMFALCDN